MAQSDEKTSLVSAAPDPLAVLSERELAAYRYWQASPDLKPLSPLLQAKMFGLFLSGHTTEEIRKLNTGINLAQIVHARIDGEWDKRLNEYRDHLFSTTLARFQQTQHEGVAFFSDMMATAHKEWGDQYKIYLQSGNPADLPDLRIKSIDSYRKAVETVKALTGETPVQRIQADVVHRVVQAPQGPPTSQEAGEALKQMLEKK